jgi:hypothetical protein
LLYISRYFDHIVNVVYTKRIVTGDIILTHSTNVKANATGDKMANKVVEKMTLEYLNTLQKKLKSVRERDWAKGRTKEEKTWLESETR